MEIDYLLRVLSSLVYRLLLLFFSAIILLTENNYFSNWLYLAIIGAYLVVITIVVIGQVEKKKFPYPILRIFIDYAFITFILYAKPISNLNNVIFFLLPVINSPNHTGNKRSVFIPVLFLMASMGILQIFEFNYLIGFVVIVAVTGMESIRLDIIKHINSLYELVDDHNIKSITSHKLHRLYREVIDRFNKHVKYDKIENITCFKIYRNGIRIVNSNKFIWSYEFALDEEKIKQLFEKDKSLSNLEFILSNEPFPSNTIIGVEIDNNRYVFVIGWSSKSMPLIRNLFVVKIFKSFFKKTAKLIALEENIRKEKINYFEKIRANVDYVNRAALAMHYLRNKFTPIKNYFKILEDQAKETDTLRKEILIKYLELERKKATESMQSILQRATTILDKSKNPFLIAKTEFHKARYLFVLAHELWVNEFGEVNIKVKELAENNNDLVRVDVDAITMVFYDLISNISKYHLDYKELIFSHDDRQIYLSFKNNVNNNKDILNELRSVIDDFMEEKKLEISKRNSYGLMNVKSFLNQMSIKYKLTLQENVFEFSLIFDRCKYENSDI